MTYQPIPRLWPDSTIVCIASGPSLTPEDVAYVRGKARVIAVNDGIRLCLDFADVLYSSDFRFWSHSVEQKQFAGMKIAIQQVKNPIPGLHRLRNAGRSGFEPNPDGLKDNQNSGGAAINLAVHFGASRILLLGYNCGTLRGRKHFFDDTDQPFQQHLKDTRVFNGFRRHFGVLAEQVAKIGVSVINCTPESSLTCFPYAPIRDVLASDAVAAPVSQEAVA